MVQDLREAVGRELRLCEEEVHRQAVDAAGSDETALKAAVRVKNHPALRFLDVMWLLLSTV